MGLPDHPHCNLSGYSVLWEEAESAPLRVGSPVLKQVDSGNRAIGIGNTAFHHQYACGYVSRIYPVFNILRAL